MRQPRYAKRDAGGRAFTLTGAGRVLAPVALVALPLGWVVGGAFALLAAMLVSALALSAFAARRRLGALAVSLPGAARAAVGDPLVLFLDVHHRGGAPSARAVLFSLRSASGGARLAARLDALAPGERRRVPALHRLLRRGRETRLVLELASSYPLGLVQARRTLVLETELLGLPRVGRLTARVLERMGTPHTSRRRPRVRRSEDEVLGVREHRPGEAARRVHWRASARRDALVLRTFTTRDEAVVRLVLLDRIERRGPWFGVGGGRDPLLAEERRAFESAVSLAATLAEDLMRRGRRVGLAFATHAPRPLQPARAGRGGFASHLLTLALVEPSVDANGKRADPAAPPAPDAHAQVRALATAALRCGELPVVVTPDHATSAALGSKLQNDVAVLDVEQLADVEAFARSRAGRQPLATAVG